MPQVPLVATKGFTYNTRRLMAGDEFEARNPLDARILTRVRKVAEAPNTDYVTDSVGSQRTVVEVADLPADVGEVKAFTPKVVAKAARKPAAKRAPKAGEKARKAKAKK